MLFRLFISCLILCSCLAVAAMGSWKESCGVDVPCEVGERSYFILPPDGWDGETPLPVLLHFHGWQRQGSLVVRHDRIASATRKRGVLLVAPNGVRKTWRFWSSDTPDVGFAKAVLADVAERFPIDADQIYISGYSFGSAMAWRYVCREGEGIAALLAIAGTLPQSEDCVEAPAEVRHVHGLADTVMDFPMGPNGDVTYPVALWRKHYGCGNGVDIGPWQQRSFLTLQRTQWECDGGRVSLDLHPGGHFIPHGWIARQLDQLLGLPYSYP